MSNGENSKYKLFCYGSLKKGHYNHFYLRHATYLGDYYIEPGYGLFVRNLPFLIKHDDGPGCYGELYEVDRLSLIDIDHLEGHPDWYRRSLVSVINLETNQRTNAYAYIYQGEKDGHFIRRF